MIGTSLKIDVTIAIYEYCRWKLGEGEKNLWLGKSSRDYLVLLDFFKKMKKSVCNFIGFFLIRIDPKIVL